jgi:hypothetical protein
MIVIDEDCLECVSGQEAGFLLALYPSVGHHEIAQWAKQRHHSPCGAHCTDYFGDLGGGKGHIVIRIHDCD